MTTEKALNQMALLVPHFAAILDDADAAEIVKTIRKEEGDVPAGSMMSQLLPLFIDKHREHMYSIVSVVSGKDVEAVRQQPIMETIRQLQLAMLEETMMLFMVCMRMVRNI